MAGGKGVSPVTAELDTRAINTARALAMDAVLKANSGHQGTPMALAPLAHVLFTRVMSYDPGEPDWPDRDRFVLSAGHASALLYAYLYLCGFGLELDDLREFRQWASTTPGHPEYGCAAGVEVTTGPLGQGFANAVGIALAQRHLHDRFGAELFSHHTYVVAGDGDLQEGISHEAASLAGHLRLASLIAVYDDNHITIDGPTELAYSDDVPGRFRAYGWHVIELGEAAEDLDVIEAGVREAADESTRPSLVVLRSHIAYPSPKFTDTPAAHGNPLDADEVSVVKEILGLPDDPFAVDADVLAHCRAAGSRGQAARAAWERRRVSWLEAHPPRADELTACLERRGVDGWAAKLPTFAAGESIATRSASKKVLSAIADVVPGLIGGGADLTGNTGTAVDGLARITPDDASGRLVHFGVREHAMGAILNGMSTSATLPFGGTFFAFSDYMRPSVRLAALSGHQSAFVWTHDSVGVGEDGPTHQPIEQLASLRVMPGLRLIRPADANEVAQAWRIHIDGRGPTGLVLTRQNVPVLEGTAERAPEGVGRGGYVLVDESGDEPDLVLIGTGSEVHVCVEAAATLVGRGVDARVVSMPSRDLFASQSPEYRRRVLPDRPTLAVEAGASAGWFDVADDVVGIDRFGMSAPGGEVLRRFGFNAAEVAERAVALLEASGR